MVKEMPLDIGLRVDVLDDEGIWNTGVIVDVGKEENLDKVEIKYDGWDEDYNQWIIVNKQRLAPLHTYTIVKKCWAKLTKWPWWPAFVVLRAPTTAVAAHGLEEEMKLYVEFYDSFNEEKRSRCWLQKKNVASFRDSFEERASKNIGKNFPKFVEGTQRAKAGTSPLLFSGPGTLPIEYSSKLSEPIEEKKKECSSEQWFHLYRDFSNRYQELYGYSTAPVLTGKQHSSFTGLKSGKRGPGRPPKQAVKQERSEDEVASEEKKPEVDDTEEISDEKEETVRGRRGTRRNKRAAAEALPARRNTQPRRVKVIEVLTDASSSMVASALSHPPCLRDSSSRSSSNTVDSTFSVLASCTKFVVESEVRQDAEPEAQPALHVQVLAPKSKPVQNLVPSLVRKEDVSMPGTEALHPIKEKPVEPFVKDGCPSKLEGVRGSCRRKDRMAPPTKLFARMQNTKTSECGGSKHASEQDSDFYQDWAGGSCYEVENKPWNILGWLTEGVKSRLQRK